MSKEQDRVSQRDGMVKVPLRFTLSRRINLQIYCMVPDNSSYQMFVVT